MTALSFQTQFAQALVSSDRPIPAGVRAHNSPSPAKRFAVYRNNVTVSLIEAVEGKFPAVRSIVGNEFFRAMARVFVEGHKPRSPLMMLYGDDFPDFLETFAPAAELPYLADVARIEAARTRAYHAADASPLAPERIAALGEEELAGALLKLHPSISVIRSPHPIVTIWAMNAGERELAPIEPWIGEDALVSRPDLAVTVSALPSGGAAFLNALASGKPLLAAAETALTDAADFDLSANLAGLFGQGLAVDIAIASP